MLVLTENTMLPQNWNIEAYASFSWNKNHPKLPENLFQKI
jgi:hypothetical protein